MPEVADASIGIHFRGDTLPAEARAAATKAGTAAGDGFSESFVKKLKNFGNAFRPTFDSAGKHAGETFSRSFVSKVNGLASRMNLRGRFGDEGRSSGLSFSEGFSQGLGRLLLATNLQVEQTGEGFRRLGKAIRGLDLPGKQFYNRWRQAPHGLRQFTFYVALFASLGESIAVLGSAAGSSLAVIGTTALAAGLGVGILVAGVIGMNGELSKIAPLARPAAVALKEMGKRFSEIRQTIQGRLFQNLAGPIQNLTNKLLPRLEDGFGKTADTMNRFLRNFSGALTTPKSLDRMTRLLDGLQPIIENLGELVINLGGSLARIFEAALPSAEAFTESMANGLARFNEFLDTAEGQQALIDFFGTLDRVMGALGPLVGATGKMLAGLVTEDSIARFERTIGLLTAFMDPLGGILRAIGALDPIGLIAQALYEIGEALGPVLPQLEALGGSVGDSIKNVFTVVGDILENLAGQAIPALAGFFEKLQPGLEDFLGLVADENTTSNGEGLVSMLEGLGTAISELIAFATDANEALSPVSDTLNSWADAFNNAGAATGDFLRNEEEMTDSFNETVNRFFSEVLANVNTWATGVRDGIRGAWEGGITAVTEWANGINETVNTFISDTIGSLMNWGLGVLASINNFTNGSLAAFAQWGRNVWGTFVNFATTVTAVVSGWVSRAVAIFVAFGTYVGGIFQRFSSTVTGIVSAFVGIVVGWFQRFASMVTGVVNAFVGLVVGRFQEFARTVTGVISGFVGIVSGAFTRMAAAAIFIVVTFVNNAVGFFRSLPGRIRDVLGGIGSIVSGAFANLGQFAQNAVNAILAPFLGIGNRIRAAIGNIGEFIGNINLPFTASGGVFAGAQARIIGEAGPEAVVPLRRNLSLVDPSVRALSAFAQGKDPGGYVGDKANNTKIVESGAIRIYTSNPDPYTTATAVLDRIVAKL